MKSATTQELRGQIDALDDQIIELLLKRIHLSNSIIQSKPPGPIVDAGREEEIYRRYLNKLAVISDPARVRNLVSAIISTSALYPEGANA